MSQEFFPVRMSEPEIVGKLVSVEGTGATAPTVLYGRGVSVTRTSEGLYKYAFGEFQGEFLGMTPGFGAATPSALAGFSLAYDDYNTTAYTIEVLLSEADNSVVDLADNQYLTLIFWFRRLD